MLSEGPAHIGISHNSLDEFAKLGAPGQRDTTPVATDDVQIVRRYFDRALDEFHLVAPTVIFTQLLHPTFAKLALNSEQYESRVTVSPQELRDFVVNLIFHGPNSSQIIDQSAKLKKTFDALDLPITSEEFSFLAYSLTHKMMQALERYGSVHPSKEEQESWFRIITLATERLGNTEITDDYEHFVRTNEALELKYLCTPNKHSIAAAQEALAQFTKPLPFALRPFAKPALVSVLEPALRSALELPEISDSKQEFYLSVLKKIGKFLNIRDRLIV